MNILVVCKRRYTGHDLLKDRFGRLYHFPRIWADKGHQVDIIAADYSNFTALVIKEDYLSLYSAPLFLPIIGFFQSLEVPLSYEEL